jgi:UDP-N-acetylmuramoylalanine--D-glutamate ligase
MEICDVRRLVVLGLRRSGKPAALLARRRMPAVEVFGLDEGAELPDGLVADLTAAGVALRLGPDAELPEGVDLIVKSPGVPDSSAIVRAAVRDEVTLWSEVEFASRFLMNPLIGITGTNGKTTTTELTGAMIRDAGLPVITGGNLGFALSEMPDVVSVDVTVVAELSSFQLEHVERFRPQAAVLLNLTEDHMDRHGSYPAYAAAKLRIFENQVDGDLALFNADDPASRAEIAGGRVAGSAARAWFSAQPGHACAGLMAGVNEAGVLWVEDEARREALCPSTELALKGTHNLQNSLAAAAAAAWHGVPAESIAGTLRTFRGVAHRLQLAGIVDGVTYVNDSKATNVDATLKALTAYSGDVHLILGGYDKGAGYDDLAGAVEGLVKEVLLIGATATRLREAFVARETVRGARPTPFRMCGDLAAAVKAASAAATPGDVVLLSPACASWDQYRDYEERGEHFLQVVSDLQGAGAG